VIKNVLLEQMAKLLSVTHEKAYFCVTGEFVWAASLKNNNKQQGEDCFFPKR